jgi:restriction system protein
MARRKEGILDLIFSVLMLGPVWLGPVLAAAVAGFGWFVLPGLFTSSSDKIPIGTTLAPLAQKIVLILAGFILVMWLISLAKRAADRKTFDSHSGLDAIKGLSWSQFERYVGEAFRRDGYHVERTGDPAGDGGVDLILHKDGMATLVQCKHWKAWKVGVKPVREFLGVVSAQGAQAAVMVTSGRFTAEAEAFAKANRIRLIDGDALATLVKSVQATEGRVPAVAATGVPASPIEAVTSSSPLCPQCGGAMAMRTARRGSGAGQQFWGCQSYPRCRGTRPA